MQWLNELPFADNRVLQIGFLAACGIAALIVLAIVYRLAFAHRLRVPGGRTRQPRLGLVDAFSLDGQRQLVLIRRDNIEHLVMIGGPNDVLVESQINRAAVPVRETTQASPLLVPTTPVRQAPLPAPAEAPAKVAAKAQASPPTLVVAGPTVAAPATPAVAAPIPAPAPPTPPAAPPPVQKAPAPAQPPASSPAFVPTQPSAPEPVRPAVSAPATTQASAPVQASAPASAPQRQPEPRPAQPRATMPPPIIPANASSNRGAPVRAAETASPSAPGNPTFSSPAAPGPSRRPERAEPAVVGSKAEPSAAKVRTEPVGAGTGTTVPPASAALAQARLTPRTPSPASSFDSAQKTVDARPLAEKTNAASIGKPTPKADDPFADLDSLEAEMARLLGREKSD
jgi:flagellar protein FliO/FliZ